MSTADDPVPVTALRPLPTGSPRRPSGEPRPPASRPLHVIRDRAQREPVAQEPELRRLLDRGARELAGLLAGDRELTAEHLAVVAARTRQLAAKGLPLPVLLGALKDAGGELLHTLPDAAADVPSLLATSSRACRVIDELTRAITEAYVEAHRWQAQDIRQLLADTLLRGEDGLALADHVGVPPNTAYVVVAADPGDDGSAADGGRLPQRLRHGPPVLVSSEKLVLVPVDPAASAQSLGPVAAELRVAVGESARIGTAVTGRAAEVPAAAREARQVLTIATRTGRPPGVYQLWDVMFEYVVSEPPDAGDRLHAVLAPLADQPSLLAALQRWVETGGSRRRTAEALGIRPNTLDSRLHRVAALTGVDPHDAGGLRLLTAALAARQILATGLTPAGPAPRPAPAADGSLLGRWARRWSADPRGGPPAPGDQLLAAVTQRVRTSPSWPADRIDPIVSAAVPIFLRALRDGGPLSPADVEPLRQAARRWSRSSPRCSP